MSRGDGENRFGTRKKAAAGRRGEAWYPISGVL